MLLTTFPVFAVDFTELIVITTDKYPIFNDTRHQITIYNVDDMQRVITNIELRANSRGIRGNGNDRIQSLHKRFREEFQKNKEKVKRSITGIALLGKYNVHKLPAIIFDDSDVIYGVTSIKEAIRIYRRKPYVMQKD